MKKLGGRGLAAFGIGTLYCGYPVFVNVPGTLGSAPGGDPPFPGIVGELDDEPAGPLPSGVDAAGAAFEPWTGGFLMSGGFTASPTRLNDVDGSLFDKVDARTLVDEPAGDAPVGVWYLDPCDA